jgi:hypothetical protein
MNDLPRQKLSELIENHGSAVLDDWERCQGWLQYSCPDHKREVNVLLAALRQRVPHELLASAEEEVLVRRLADERALTEEAARWGVKAWRLALEKPVPATPPAAESNGKRFASSRPVAAAVGFAQRLQTDNPMPPAGVGFQDEKSRDLFIQQMDSIAACHEEIKQALEKDISGQVFLVGVFSSVIFGLFAYFIARECSDYSTKDTNSTLAAGVAVAASFVIAYFLTSSDKSNETRSRREKLAGLIRQAVDAFPKPIHSCGGPLALENHHAVRRLICAAKADQLLPQAAVAGENKPRSDGFVPASAAEPRNSGAPGEEKSFNGMAITGFVLGLVSTVLYPIGIIPILGIVFSGIGMGTFKPQKQKAKWMAPTGLFFSIVYAVMFLTARR